MAEVSYLHLLSCLSLILTCRSTDTTRYITCEDYCLSKTDTSSSLRTTTSERIPSTPDASISVSDHSSAMSTTQPTKPTATPIASTLEQTDSTAPTELTTAPTEPTTAPTEQTAPIEQSSTPTEAITAPTETKTVPIETTATIEKTTTPTEQTIASTETTIAPTETTTAPTESTTVATGTTTTPIEKTTTPTEQTTASTETTIAPTEPTAAPTETTTTQTEETTTSTEPTTAPIELTTALTETATAPTESTTAPTETTTAPTETTTASTETSTETTTAPTESTTVPTGTTTAPIEKTTTPNEPTTAPTETTTAPTEETTTPTEPTTAPIEPTTAPTEQTTAPNKTTTPTEQTTAPTEPTPAPSKLRIALNGPTTAATTEPTASSTEATAISTEPPPAPNNCTCDYISTPSTLNLSSESTTTQLTTTLSIVPTVYPSEMPNLERAKYVLQFEVKIEDADINALKNETVKADFNSSFYEMLENILNDTGCTQYLVGEYKPGSIIAHVESTYGIQFNVTSVQQMTSVLQKMKTNVENLNISFPLGSLNMSSLNYELDKLNETVSTQPCSFLQNVSCSTWTDFICNDPDPNAWICKHKCNDGNYCGEYGDCFNNIISGAIACRCKTSSYYVYFGPRCADSTVNMTFILAVTVGSGGGLIVVFGIVLVCVCRRCLKRGKQGIRSIKDEKDPDDIQSDTQSDIQSDTQSQPDMHRGSGVSNQEYELYPNKHYGMRSSVYLPNNNRESIQSVEQYDIINESTVPSFLTMDVKRDYSIKRPTITAQKKGLYN